MFIKRFLFVLFNTMMIILLFMVNGATVRMVSAKAATGYASLSSCGSFTKFERGNFSKPTRINNRYYPLTPGLQFTLSGTTSAGTHTVVFTVTDLTKVIDGVTTRVLWDQDFQDGELAESELAFQAQDNAGNVWVLGEYPEEYEAGQFTGAPFTWMNGIDHANAGVLVPGEPMLDKAAFLEGKSPSIDFWDCGQVNALGQMVSVPTGEYKNVLVINEWAPLEHSSAIQQKFYAPGVGVAQIGAINDPEAETLVLTKFDRLNTGQLAAVRKEALKLDMHGYQVSSVYSQTQPAK